MRAEDLLQAHILWRGDSVLLRLAGELDLATAPLVNRAVTTSLAAHPRCLRLALTDLAFCDGAGLRALHHLTTKTHTSHTAPPPPPPPPPPDPDPPRHPLAVGPAPAPGRHPTTDTREIETPAGRNDGARSQPPSKAAPKQVLPSAAGPRTTPHRPVP
ncbi:STAS domain-containing protein [Streptomyces chryseus]